MKRVSVEGANGCCSGGELCWRFFVMLPYDGCGFEISFRVFFIIYMYISVSVIQCIFEFHNQ